MEGNISKYGIVALLASYVRVNPSGPTADDGRRRKNPSGTDGHCVRRRRVGKERCRCSGDGGFDVVDPIVNFLSGGWRGNFVPFHKGSLLVRLFVFCCVMLS